MELGFPPDFNFDSLMEHLATESCSQDTSNDDLFALSPLSCLDSLMCIEGSMTTPRSLAINSLNNFLPLAPPSSASPAPSATSMGSGMGPELQPGVERGLSELLDLQTRLSHDIIGTPSYLARAQGQARLLRRKMRGIRRKLETICPKKTRKEKE